MTRKIRIDYGELMRRALKPLPTFQDVYREEYLKALKLTAPKRQVKICHL